MTEVESDDSTFPTVIADPHTAPSDSTYRILKPFPRSSTFLKL